MDKKRVIIVCSVLFGVLTLLVVISYLNAIKQSNGNKNDTLETITQILNVSSILFLIFVLIFGSCVYFVSITRIEDLNKQCYIHLSVFFGALLLIVVLANVTVLVQRQSGKGETVLHNTVINFATMVILLIVVVSGILMLTVFIMSFFWCTTKVNRWAMSPNS